MERALQRLQQDLRLRNLANNTQKTYIYSIKRFAQTTSIELESITDNDIRDYLDRLVLDGKAPAYVNHERAALIFLVEITLGRSVNKRLVPPMKISRGLPDVFSRTEIERIITFEPDLRNKCLWMLGYGSGLRKLEALSLRVLDIRSDEMRLFIRNGKRGKDRFTILPETTLEHLRRWWRIRPTSDKDWLFPSNKTTGHISRAVIDSHFPEALARAHITRNTACYHSLRRSFASHLVEDGIDQFSLKELMGHSSLNSTAIYVHLANASAGVVSPLDCMRENIDGQK